MECVGHASRVIRLLRQIVSPESIGVRGIRRHDMRELKGVTGYADYPAQ